MSIHAKALEVLRLVTEIIKEGQEQNSNPAVAGLFRTFGANFLTTARQIVSWTITLQSPSGD